MGSFAYLVTTDSDSFSDYYNTEHHDDNMYLLQKYGLPPFWLALFTETDLRKEEVTDEDGDTFETSFFITTKENGMKNFESNKGMLIRRFGEGVSELIEQFGAYASQHSGDNFLLDTSELQLVDDIESNFWSKELVTSHAIITKRDENVPKEKFISKAGHETGFLGFYQYLDKYDIALENKYEYVGTSVGEPAPWEERVDVDDAMEDLKIADSKTSFLEKLKGFFR